MFRSLSSILRGTGDTLGIGQGFKSAIGFAALSDIKDAYITKARGGTDEMGIKWAPLKPATIANRRIGQPRGEAATAIRERQKIQKRETRKALARFRLRLPEGEARRRAAIVGGIKATQITGKTKVETLGGRSVEILRDTGVLLNSLSPGELSASRYTKPSDEGGSEQIFDVSGDIVVGTNVVYAGPHQHGTQHIPARPFLPDEDHPVPQSWWDRWLAAGVQALAAGLQRLIQSKG